MSEYKLDKWNLSELTKDPKSPAFQKQIKEVEALAKKFEKIKTKLEPKMSSKNLWVFYMKLKKFLKK